MASILTRHQTRAKTPKPVISASVTVFIAPMLHRAAHLAFVLGCSNRHLTGELGRITTEVAPFPLEPLHETVLSRISLLDKFRHRMVSLAEDFLIWQENDADVVCARLLAETDRKST